MFYRENKQNTVENTVNCLNVVLEISLLQYLISSWLTMLFERATIFPSELRRPSDLCWLLRFFVLSPTRRAPLRSYRFERRVTPSPNGRWYCFPTPCPRTWHYAFGFVRSTSCPPSSLVFSPLEVSRRFPCFTRFCVLAMRIRRRPLKRVLVPAGHWSFRPSR